MRLDRLLGAIARRDEVRLRVDRDLVVPAERLARQRIEGRSSSSTSSPNSSMRSAVSSYDG